MGRAPGLPGTHVPVGKTENEQVNKMLSIVQAVLPFIMTVKYSGELVYIE